MLHGPGVHSEYFPQQSSLNPGLLSQLPSGSAEQQPLLPDSDPSIQSLDF